MDHSPEINELATALAKAQASIKTALKTSDNPFFKSKYADLATVSEACLAALNSNGLSVVQGGEQSDGDRIPVTTLLLHTSGQWISSTITMKPVKADPQGIGSCITYARRYGLAAICGVVTDDDDGNAASGNTHKSHADELPGTNPLPPDNKNDSKEKSDLRTSIFRELGSPALTEAQRQTWTHKATVAKTLQELRDLLSTIKKHSDPQ